MGTTNNTDTERAFAGAGTTACPCGAETNGAEGSRTRGYTALQVLDLLNAQQVALLAGAEKRAARLRDAVFAAGRAAGAPEGLDPVALAEWIEHIASLREVRVASMTPAGGCVMASTEPAECSSDAADAQAFRALCDARPAVADEKARAAMGYFDVVRREIRNDLRAEVLREIRNEFPTPEGCTLGPWRVCIESTSRDSRVSWEVIGMSDKGERRPVCSGYGRISDGFPSDDEAIGNAHLIGAAFDLLAACEAALADRFGGDDPCVDLDPINNRLRAAITKAKGGAA